MRSVTSWLLVIGAFAFWIFRIVVLVCYSLSIEFPIKPIDSALEIPMLFITLICLILILKRNIIGGLAYFFIYAGYFGLDIVNIITTQGVSIGIVTLNILVSVFAVILALANAIDIAWTRSGNTTGKSKKTDWFYKNEQFDRELDERADKNNYRIH